MVGGLKIERAQKRRLSHLTERDLSGGKAEDCRPLDVCPTDTCKQWILWLAVKMSISFAKEAE